ncbi:MAG: hypothetical protein IK118_01840 [Clostridia bacterium]|nr:hypothetical protein [Clostridia bacterium]
MEKRFFSIYQEEHSSFFGSIIDGRLSLEYDLDGDGSYPDTEEHFSFTKEDTAKLFSIISPDDFIELCRSQHPSGMKCFLEEYDIHPETFVW